MKWRVGMHVSCTVGSMNAPYKLRWGRSHPGEDPDAVRMVGEVVATNVGWVIVAFPSADPPLDVPAKLRPKDLEPAGDLHIPQYSLGQPMGSSNPTPNADSANKKTMLEAAMADEGDAGEDDPLPEDYGPAPQPPASAWRRVGLQPGDATWQCPRSLTSSVHGRQMGQMRLGCPPDQLDPVAFFHAFFPVAAWAESLPQMNAAAAEAGRTVQKFTQAEFYVWVGLFFIMCRFQTVG